jgi:hypothetical protein
MMTESISNSSYVHGSADEPTIGLDENNNRVNLMVPLSTNLVTPSSSSSSNDSSVHLDRSLGTDLTVSSFPNPSSTSSFVSTLVKSNVPLRPVEFVCSSSIESPLAFCISNGRLWEYQRSPLALSFGKASSPSKSSRSHLHTWCSKLKNVAYAHASPLDLLRITMYAYLIIDVLLNLLLLAHISQLNSMFILRVRATVGANPLDCSPDQARPLLIAILLSALALDALGVFAVASGDLWLALLNVCQISLNLLKVCFLFDSSFVFLVHLLFVFVAAIHTALLLPTDIFP